MQKYIHVARMYPYCKNISLLQEWILVARIYSRCKNAFTLEEYIHVARMHSCYKNIFTLQEYIIQTIAFLWIIKLSNKHLSHYCTDERLKNYPYDASQFGKLNIFRTQRFEHIKNTFFYPLKFRIILQKGFTIRLSVITTNALFLTGGFLKNRILLECEMLWILIVMNPSINAYTNCILTNMRIY